MNRLGLSLAAAAALALTAPAAAQLNVGAQVVDTSGAPVGTVIAVKGDTLVVRTDRHEVHLPAASFTPNEGKLFFAMTRDQLNAETDKALAAAAATLVAGAEVRGKGGEIAGNIDSIDEASVTLKLVSGELVRLPRNSVAGTPKGPVLGVTAEELKAIADKARADAATPEPQADGGR